MKVETWKIIPTGLSGMHLGQHGIEQEKSSVHFRSDSLFSAIVASLAALSGPAVVDEMLEDFRNDTPPFVITSAFPFAGPVRFYPLPMTSLKTNAEAMEKKSLQTKDLKKIKFVSEKIFKNLLERKMSLVEMYNPECLLKGGLFVTKEEFDALPALIQTGEMNVFNNKEEHPRVAIDRVNNSSTLFFTGAVRYAPDCGLWFGLKWNDGQSVWKEKFSSILMFLSDNGIGGERSSGYGQVEIKTWDEITLPHSEDSEWTTLSRYIPKKTEMPALLHENASYGLEQVGGWLQSPGNMAERRRTINMLREGSVFGPTNTKPTGALVDLRPIYKQSSFSAHPVYRSGLAFGVGFSKENAK